MWFIATTFIKNGCYKPAQTRQINVESRSGFLTTHNRGCFLVKSTIEKLITLYLSDENGVALLKIGQLKDNN